MTKHRNAKNDFKIDGQSFENWIGALPEDFNYDIEETTLKYDKKLVAFIDLLGMTRSIRDATEGEERLIISKMTTIKDIVEDEIEHKKSEIDMLYISDSFIFVSPPELIVEMLDILANIQMRILVECQTMLRGAVEYGDVIVSDEGKQIIGPAYIEAYEKQEKHAIFPRIILGNSVLNNKKKYLKKIVAKDRETSLDYVDVYMAMESTSTQEMQKKLKREGTYKYLVDSYKTHHNNSSIRAKYAWTINYLNDKEVWSDEKQYSCW